MDVSIFEIQVIRQGTNKLNAQMPRDNYLSTEARVARRDGQKNNTYY